MKSLRVFVVENDASLLSLLIRILRRIGHHVVGSLATAQTALEIASVLKPDVILTEIHLDEAFDGIAVAISFNSHLKRPVIIMCLHEDEHFIEVDSAMNQHQLLRKPFSSQQLADAISRAYSSRLSSRKL